LKLFEDKDAINEMITRNLNQDYSWRKVAKEYEQIYKKVLKEQTKENE